MLFVEAAPIAVTVKVRDIYVKLPSSVILDREVGEERNKIMKDVRANQLRTLLNELRELQSQLTDAKKPLDEVTNREVARKYEIKRMEAQNIKQEFESFRAEQEVKINKELVRRMKALLVKIAQASEDVAKEKGYEMLFDISGLTNSGMPFMLFNKDTPDITEDVLARLMLKEPAMPETKAPEQATKLEEVPEGGNKQPNP